MKLELRKTLLISFLILFTIMVSGCGHLFFSSDKDILLDTEPAQAEVWIKGVKVGTTPMTINLSNREDHQITFRKDGFDDVTCHLDPKDHNGIMVLDILGGLIFAGLIMIVDGETDVFDGLYVTTIPLIIDTGTGRRKKISEDRCIRQLIPE